MSIYDEMSDSSLYNRYREGDTTAYDQLMIRHGDSLTMYLHGFLHDWHDSEDLMIEAFARIMVKKPRISDGAFKAYLFRTGRNLASRFHAKQSRFSRVGLDETSGADPEGDEIEKKLADEVRKRTLHLCLDRLDPELRDALWLVYFEDMSYAQAASVMGVKVKRIEYLLAKGKRRMQNELEKEGVTNAYE